MSIVYRNFERLRCSSGDFAVGLSTPAKNIGAHVRGGSELQGYIAADARGGYGDLLKTNRSSDMLVVSNVAKQALEEFGACHFEEIIFSPKLDQSYWLILPEIIRTRCDDFVFSATYDSIQFDEALGRYGWTADAPFFVDGGQVEANQLFVTIATLGHPNIFIAQGFKKVIKRIKLKGFVYHAAQAAQLGRRVSMF